MAQQLVQLNSRKNQTPPPESKLVPPFEIPSTMWIYRMKWKVFFLNLFYAFQSTHPWASLRRNAMAILLPKAYAKQLRNRVEGECNRCGHCCRLLFDCPFLYQEPGGPSHCTIYMTKHAPRVCVIYPLDPWDLAEIKRAVAPNECSFTFAPEPEKAATPSFSTRFLAPLRRLMRSAQE